jgi:hypothetical protein
MRVYEEKSIIEMRDHDEFWSGAISTINYLTDDELDMIEGILDESGEGMGMGELNDFFWFEDDTIAEWLGYNNFDEIMKRNEDE